MQQVNSGVYKLPAILRKVNAEKVFLVCGPSFPYPNTETIFEAMDTAFVKFSNFTPNPQYEDVCEGVKLFNRAQCDAIVAVGGGSAMDVAKCIKLFCKMNPDQNYLTQEYTDSGVPLIALPTTAGTGSESTRYAVIYYEGKKQSVTHDSIIPNYAVLEPAFLKALPVYQRKSTMLDALCHAIESFWSVNSTDESKAYSAEAIKLIIENRKDYLANDERANANMLLAANIAGKAINITQTTAGHAMCYQITKLFGCAHGHAAALCDRRLFPWTIRNAERCVDPRGARYLRDTLDQLGTAMGCDGAWPAAERLNELFDELGLTVPAASEEQYRLLKASVNPVRLKNHPVQLTEENIDILYHEILR